MLEQCYYQIVQYVIIKNQDLSKSRGKRTIKSFGIRTPLSKVPILDDILF